MPYKSKFHRYSDLILTAVAEPWAQRHSGDLDHMRRRTYKAWAGMPREYKPALRSRHRRRSGSSASTFCGRVWDSAFKNSAAKDHNFFRSNRLTVLR